jgi:signal transduction histidine kinase
VDDQVEITVRDNGPGIPAKEQDRIFERFYRLEKSRKRESGGTGLGLAIVRHVARLHEGTIHLESRPGKGSTFTLTVPAWKGKKA